MQEQEGIQNLLMNFLPLLLSMVFFLLAVIMGGMNNINDNNWIISGHL